jgi:hypothetical protein
MYSFCIARGTYTHLVTGDPVSTCRDTICVFFSCTRKYVRYASVDTACLLSRRVSIALPGLRSQSPCCFSFLTAPQLHQGKHHVVLGFQVWLWHTDLYSTRASPTAAHPDMLLLLLQRAPQRSWPRASKCSCR